MNVVVAWMYSSPERESFRHAQTGANSGSQEIKNYYWRCAFLLFESSSRVNSAVRHILFLNKMPPEEIDGVSTQRLIEQYNVEIRFLDKITTSPKDYYGAWNTQFIVIDILEKLQCILDNNDIVLLLDSDVIFNNPIGDEFETHVKRERALLYTMEYGTTYKINGLSPTDLLEVSREINRDFPDEEFIYSGGEFVCCLGSEVGKIAEMARRTYNACLERYTQGLRKFNEEAHLLSYVYHVLGYRSGSANKYMKRIWTDRSIYSNIDGSEKDLILWHLPAEKKRGFVEVFRTYTHVGERYAIDTGKLAQKYRVIEPFGEKTQRYYTIVKKYILNLFGS